MSGRWTFLFSRIHSESYLDQINTEPMVSQIGMLSVVEAPDILYNQVSFFEKGLYFADCYNTDQLLRKVTVLILATLATATDNMGNKVTTNISDKQRHNHNGGGKRTAEMRSKVPIIKEV